MVIDISSYINNSQNNIYNPDIIDYMNILSKISTKIWKNIASKREIHMFCKLEEWLDLQYGEGE